MSTEALLKLSDRLSSFTDRVGKGGSIFILPLVFVTMWDVTVRKLGGLQVYMAENFGRAFESTIIQELEWHFHTALFTLVLGYGFINNRHVRVDLLREKLSFRKQAWIEFLGITFFLLPYCVIVGFFAVSYAYESFLTNEISASTVGLSHRWIIKSVLPIGLFMTGVAGFAVWLQTVLVLFGPKDFRFKLMTLQWPEDAQAKADARRVREADAAAQREQDKQDRAAAREQQNP